MPYGGKFFSSGVVEKELLWKKRTQEEGGNHHSFCCWELSPRLPYEWGALFLLHLNEAFLEEALKWSEVLWGCVCIPISGSNFHEWGEKLPFRAWK